MQSERAGLGPATGVIYQDRALSSLGENAETHSISRVRACLERLLDLIERGAQLLVREEELGPLHLCRSSRLPRHPSSACRRRRTPLPVRTRSYLGVITPKIRHKMTLAEVPCLPLQRVCTLSMRPLFTSPLMRPRSVFQKRAVLRRSQQWGESCWRLSLWSVPGK